MLKKTKLKNFTVTKLNGKKVKEGDKIAVFNGAIAVLTEVINATRDYCKLRRKKFDMHTKLYDPENNVFLIDHTFRQLKWLSYEDLDFLETNVGDYNEEADIYGPSCVDVHDIMVYIEHITYLARELCHDF